MSDHDALLEGGVEVLASVPAVHGDLHGIQFFLGVLTWLESVIRHANVVVKQSHVAI